MSEPFGPEDIEVVADLGRDVVTIRPTLNGRAVLTIEFSPSETKQLIANLQAAANLIENVAK